jgi:5-methylcytosine-specific restriction endonuclease McrA
MNIIWKGAAALSLAVAGLTMAAPAQAQYYGGHRDGWRGDRGQNWHGSRWDNRRHWRGDRRDWRDNRRNWRGYRQRCWTEWRYDYYRDRDVRVRICR